MVRAWKKEMVKELSEELKKYDVIGIVDYHAVPAKQLQIIKKNLKQSNVRLMMTRKRIIERVLNKSDKKNVEGLKQEMGRMPALALSSIDPFKLAKIINDSKSPAPAKPGQIAPKNLVVPAGPTPFTPGPIIGELGSLGIKTKVEAGKLEITKDTVVVKKGEEVSEKAARILKRLGVEPMEIGLAINAVWENGIIFSAEQLKIDVSEYEERLESAHAQAIALSINTNTPVKQTVKPILQKLHAQAKALSVETGFLTEQTREDIIRKAEGQAKSLAENVKDKEIGDESENTKDSKEKKGG